MKIGNIKGIQNYNYIIGRNVRVSGILKKVIVGVFVAMLLLVLGVVDAVARTEKSVGDKNPVGIKDRIEARIKDELGTDTEIYQKIKLQEPTLSETEIMEKIKEEKAKIVEEEVEIDVTEFAKKIEPIRIETIKLELVKLITADIKTLEIQFMKILHYKPEEIQIAIAQLSSQQIQALYIKLLDIETLRVITTQLPPQQIKTLAIVIYDVTGQSKLLGQKIDEWVAIKSLQELLKNEPIRQLQKKSIKGFIIDEVVDSQGQNIHISDCSDFLNMFEDERKIREKKPRAIILNWGSFNNIDITETRQFQKFASNTLWVYYRRYKELFPDIPVGVVVSLTKNYKEFLDSLKLIEFDFYAVWYVVNPDVNIKKIKEVINKDDIVLCYFPYGVEENYKLIGGQKWEKWLRGLEKEKIKGLLVIK